MAQWQAAPASPSMTMLNRDLRVAAHADVPVLITAEGRRQREVCARLIHAGGRRPRGPFVTFATHADPPAGEAPLSSQKHARDEGGTLRLRFDQARGGTLFIDDVAWLTHAAQTELNTLLDDRPAPDPSDVHERAGGAVRVIAGASRHLVAERQTGAFCESLFYRLNVVHIDLIVRQTLTARDLMTSPGRACRPDTDLAAVAQLMWDCDCGFVPVVEASGKVAGVITDRDVCIGTATRNLLPGWIQASQVMTARVHACGPGDDIRQVLDVMKRYQVRRLPVIDAEGRLQGVISMNDIIAAAARRRVPGAEDILVAMAAIGARWSVSGSRPVHEWPAPTADGNPRMPPPPLLA